MPELPTGTVTFLLTDLVSSTRLWEENADDTMSVAFEHHDSALRDAIRDRGGIVISSAGDGLAAVFASATDALAAAIAAQQALTHHDDLHARMGLHTDEGRLRSPGEYVNRPINRCARLMAIAHGRQILVSGATANVVRGALPPDTSLRDLGEHRLRDLAEPMHVFQALHATLPSDFPALRSLATLPGNLPRQLTSFVGREDQIAQLCSLVRERSLVTLTGVGGVGKTRLALQVAAEVAGDLHDGAWLCELAGVSDPDAVWDTVAASIGVRLQAGRNIRDLVLEFLSAKEMLIVLDNCEHLLAPVGRVVEAIVQRCTDVTVLATSREGIGLPGEQIVAVPSLPVPERDSDVATLAATDAVHLFCDRALDVNREFELTERNARAVAQICRRLDGIPLAIELAAARVRSLSPDDLVARLDQRFRLLTKGSRSALERHQTLRNTIDWSYDLLTPTERTALNRMSVFAGGCDLAAAEAVLAGEDIEALDVVDVLGQLVDKSLIDVDVSDRPQRCRLLETIRQYAQERLEASGEMPSVHDRHLAHYLARAEEAGPHLRSRDQVAWANALARDVDNFRTALDWAVEAGHPDDALRLVAPMMVTGIPTGWTATEWSETAIGIAGASEHELFPLAAAYAAMGAAMRGDVERGSELVVVAQQSQERLGTNHLWVHAAAGTVAFFQGMPERGHEHAQHWLDRARAENDMYEISHALILLGATVSNHSPVTEFAPQEARIIAEEAVESARACGVPSALLYALIVLAQTLGRDEPARARALIREAADVARQLGDRQAVATSVGFLGGIAILQEDWAEALRVLTDSVEQHLRAGVSSPLGGALKMAMVALDRLDSEPAAVISGFAGMRFQQPFGDEWWLATVATTEQRITESLGQARSEELRARGARMSVAEAVAFLRQQCDRILAEHRGHGDGQLSGNQAGRTT